MNSSLLPTTAYINHTIEYSLSVTEIPEYIHAAADSFTANVP